MKKKNKVRSNILLFEIEAVRDFPVAQMIKNCLHCRRPGFDPWVGKIPWRRAWQSPPAFLPGESHGQRSLAGHSSWGPKEADMTEQLTHTHRAVYGKK